MNYISFEWVDNNIECGGGGGGGVLMTEIVDDIKVC